MKRAAFYLQVSTADQHPQNQTHDLEQLAAQRGWEVVQRYCDHGYSGARPSPSTGPITGRRSSRSLRYRRSVELRSVGTFGPALH